MNDERTPVRYSVLGPSGDAITGFDSILQAAAWAKRTWPHLDHDPDRSGQGWDVEVSPIEAVN